MFKKLFVIILILPIFGCAEYRWEFYSADESTMNSFREDVIKDKAMIGLAIKGTESRTHIPLIWRKVIAKSPYSIELAVTTELETFDYILINSAHLVKETGDVVSIMGNTNSLKIDFEDGEFSKFTHGKVRQAYYEFPQKLEIDYLKNKKILLKVSISIISKGVSKERKIKAPFYSVLEEGTTFIFSTYTN